MVTWEWTRKRITPPDVLDAAQSIPVNNNWITFDLIADWGWKPSAMYLEWAKKGLEQHDQCGWDSAAGWAKRAVCRRMDGILAHNHLVSSLSKNYKTKSQLLSKLNVPGLKLLRDTVIDPRNGIEHEYAAANEEQAERAFEVAELFLLATEKEADIPAIISLSWNADHYGEVCCTPGREYERHIFGLTANHGPMLLIDHFAEEPVVIVTHPKDALLRHCELREFHSDQVITLNHRLRKCLNPDKGGSYTFSSRQYNREMWKLVQHQLGLSQNPAA